MTRDDMTLVAAVAGGSSLIPWLLGAAVGLPVWLCCLLSATGIACAFFLAKSRMQRYQQAQRRPPLFVPPQVPEPSAQPDPPRASAIVSLPVPSGEVDYQFLFTATVWWRATRSGVNAEAIARKAVLDRACSLTTRAEPGNPALTSAQLAAHLVSPQADPTGAVEAWADQVALVLPDDDRERLAKLAALRKDVRVWEQQRGMELSIRDYLGNDVLKTPGNAVVWKLAQDHKQISETVNLIPTLVRLTAAANDHELPDQRSNWDDVVEATVVPDPPRESAPPAPEAPVDHLRGLLDELFGSAQSDQRDLFAQQLSTLIESHGRRQAAQSLRDDSAGGETDRPGPSDDASAAVPDESLDLFGPDLDGDEPPAPDSGLNSAPVTGAGASRV